MSSENSIGNIKIASNGLSSSEICFTEAHSNRDIVNNTPAHVDTEPQAKRIKRTCKTEFKYNDEANSSHLSDEYSNATDQQQLLANKFSPSKVIDADFLYTLEGVVIEPNGCHVLDMWLKAPESEGEHKFYFMFFYQEQLIPVNDESGADQKHSKRKMSISQNLK